MDPVKFTRDFVDHVRFTRDLVDPVKFDTRDYVHLVRFEVQNYVDYVRYTRDFVDLARLMYKASWTL